ncbi:hypothetical protein Belba_0590 [Belliella baltica DSM 15883]|uniref:Uncharacterized protein n=1 Tax=Belliella baltica (strain DSM 15883 / CIP 108006 / LMG 21964 / BA134) TaxID=866536 RepID=I3Z1X9_BELBD|nr:hypothetical protein Belba_0590 [Belliella baltica DSM 15883]
MLNIDFSKISTEVWLTILLLLFATVIPGFLFFFIYDQYLFLNLDTTKLIFLSFAITSPLWVINSLIYLVLETKLHDEVPTDLLKICSMAGSTFAIFIIYCVIILNIFFDFSILENLYLVLFLQLLVFVFIWAIEHKQFKKASTD